MESEIEEVAPAAREMTVEEQLGLSERGAKELESAKERGIEPFYTRINNKEFIYRAIKRSEWRKLRARVQKKAEEAAGDDAKLMEVREEELEQVILIAEVYYEQSSEDLPAGTFETLTDTILLSSGFGGVDIDPVQL